MYAYKDLLELAGLTTRLYTLLSTLHHLKPLPEFVRSPESVEFKNVVVGVPKRNAELGEAPLVNTKTGEERSEEVYDFAENSLEGTGISEDRALVRGLSLRVERGEHLMISGPVRVPWSCS
jgi:ATP-binding cassette, subfamily D (ALD), peroxisomal long-chain fatty acid import protein